jgi:predicted transposase/invertase (TIGR01784 family)
VKKISMQTIIESKLEKGLAEGRAEGVKEGMKAVALKMLQEELSLETISHITGFTQKEILDIKEG